MATLTIDEEQLSEVLAAFMTRPLRLEILSRVRELSETTGPGRAGHERMDTHEALPPAAASRAGLELPAEPPRRLSTAALWTWAQLWQWGPKWRSEHTVQEVLGQTGGGDYPWTKERLEEVLDELRDAGVFAGDTPGPPVLMTGSLRVQTGRRALMVMSLEVFADHEVYDSDVDALGDAGTLVWKILETTGRPEPSERWSLYWAGNEEHGLMMVCSSSFDARNEALGRLGEIAWERDPENPDWRAPRVWALWLGDIDDTHRPDEPGPPTAAVLESLGATIEGDRIRQGDRTLPLGLGPSVE